MKIKGIITLPEPLHCREDALTSYECTVNDIQVTIQFPIYVFRERESLENRLDPPEIGKGLRRGDAGVDWGYLVRYYMHPQTDKNEYALAVVNTIAIEFEGDEELAQCVYREFNQWLERFECYCLLANRQFLYHPNTKAEGGNYIELLSEKGYIQPADQTFTMELSLVTEDSCIKREEVEKAIKYASSTHAIRPEYKFIYQAYEAEKKCEHRLSIIDACSALEMCLLSSIESYCIKHVIDPDLITCKYRYLGEMIDFVSRIDAGFSVMKKPLREKVLKVRNDVLHCNRNPYPTSQEAKAVISTINEALEYFYDDYY